MSADVLTVDQVAELLHCAGTTVEDRARRGELPGLQFGLSWVFPRGALLRRLDELALAQADTRRRPRAPSGVLTVLDAKTKRSPPALPLP